jgi:hypothetical protein
VTIQATTASASIEFFLQAYVDLQDEDDQQPDACVDDVYDCEEVNGSKPGLVDHCGDSVEADEGIESAEGGAIGRRDLRVLAKGRGVGPVLADERAQIADASQRRGLIDIRGVGDIAVKRGDDEQVTHCSQRVQGHRDCARKMPVFEHVGLELEHQQQDHPCRRIDRGGVCLEDLTARDAPGIFEPRSGPFLAEKDEDVDSQQGINRVLEKLVQDSAVDFQAVAPPESPPDIGRQAVISTDFGIN